jgi:hypothetical protein
MRPALALLALGLAAPLQAGGLELTLGGGVTLPSYEQHFDYDPQGLLPAGFPLHTTGGFGLDASGALALYGGVSFPLVGPLAVEARVDAARIDTAVQGTALGSDRLPGVVLAATGTVEMDRLYPVSVGLRLGFGPLYLAGGATWLRATPFTAAVDTALHVGVDGNGLDVPIGTVVATGELPGGLGGNAALGVRLGLGLRLHLVLEARGFLLPEGTLEWDADPGAPLASRELASRLDPIKIRPAFYQGTAALSLSF